MAVTKVNGGIITDQMLSGSLKFFKMTGAFSYAVSDGTVNIDSSSAGGSPGVTYYHVVANGKPVPGSLADLALRTISEKCTIVSIGVVGAPGSETAIHFSVENTSFGWINAATGAVDTASMVAAIGLLGATVTVPTTTGGAVDDRTAVPVTANASTVVTIVETPFILA